MNNMIYSVGIIPFYIDDSNNLKFFLGHPGGNYPSSTNMWLFLKGCSENDEKWEDTAIREFEEESGVELSDEEKSSLIPLGCIQQNSRKMAVAFGLFKYDIDPDNCKSNIMEGKTFPEIDSFRWIDYNDISNCTLPSHMPFYNRIKEISEKVLSE